MVERLRIVGRDHDRRVPLEAILQVRRRVAVRELRPRHDVAHLLRAVVVARDLAAVLAGVDDVGVLRIDGHPAAFPAAGRVPVLRVDRVAGDRARNADVAVVLLRAIDPVRELIVRRDPIELRRRLIVLRRPGLSAVERDGGAAVVAQDHPARVVRIDPEIVVVSVGHRQVGEGLPAVGRLVHLDVREINGVGVPRIGSDPRVVPGALADLVIVVDLRELAAVVLAAEEAAVLRLDEREHASGPGRGDRHADLAPRALGQPLGQLLPRVAAVGRLPEAAPRSARDEVPGAAHDLPEARVQRAGVVGVHREIGGARLVVDEEDLLPALAAVLGAEDPALGVGSPGVAERGHVDEVRVRRVHAHARNLPRVGKPHVLPGLSAVGRLVHAVAVREVASDVRLPHADVDHVRIRLGHGDRADRARLEVLVGHDLPVGAAVGRLPDPAAGGAEVEDVGLVAYADDRDRAAAAVWTDRAEAQALELIRQGPGFILVLLLVLGACRGSRGLPRRGDGEEDSGGGQRQAQEDEGRPGEACESHEAPFENGRETAEKSIAAAGARVDDRESSGPRDARWDLRHHSGKLRPDGRTVPLLPDPHARRDAGVLRPARRRALASHRGRRAAARLVDQGRRRTRAALLPRQRRQRGRSPGPRADPQRAAGARRVPGRLPRLRAVGGIALRGRAVPRRARRVRRGALALPRQPDRALRRVARLRRRDPTGDRTAVRRRRPRDAVSLDRGDGAQALPVRAGLPDPQPLRQRGEDRVGRGAQAVPRRGERRGRAARAGAAALRGRLGAEDALRHPRLGPQRHLRDGRRAVLEGVGEVPGGL